MTELLDVNSADPKAVDACPPLAGHGNEFFRYREDRGGFTALRRLDEVPGLAGKLDDAARAPSTVGR